MQNVVYQNFENNIEIVDQIVEFFKKPMNIILMGTIITIGGALFGGLVAAVGTYLQNRSSTDRNNRIETGVGDLKNQNYQLQDKLEKQAEIIDKLREGNLVLITQNTGLSTANEKISKSNEQLNFQNSGMLSRIDKYQSDIEERNKLIEKLKADFTDFKEYNYYANLNTFGLDKMYDNQTLTGFHTDLSERMYKFVNFKKENVFSIIPDKSLLPDVNEVIRKYPKFPFIYWVKAFIEQSNGYPSWRESAEKGISILEITTKIEGHNKAHDETLKILKDGISKSDAKKK